MYELGVSIKLPAISYQLIKKACSLERAFFFVVVLKDCIGVYTTANAGDST